MKRWVAIVTLIGISLLLGFVLGVGFTRRLEFADRLVSQALEHNVDQEPQLAVYKFRMARLLGRDGPGERLFLATSYIDLGKYRQAIPELQRSLEMGQGYAAATFLAYSHARIGERQKSLEMCEEVKKQLGSEDGLNRYNLAGTYAILGLHNEAIDYLQQAIALDGEYKVMAKSDRDFDSIRHLDEFKQLVERE